MTMTNKMPIRYQGGRYIPAALFASVVLNLLLVGVVVDVMPSHKGGTHFGPLSLAYQHGDLIEERLAHYLNAADAAAFHEAMQPQTEALKQAHAHVRDATKEVAVAYEQDPSDSAALLSALDHVKQAKDEVNDVVSKIIVDSSSKLSLEGRHHLAEMTR